MTVQRNYKGIWIPRAIWENNIMSANEKILFADIASMLTQGMEFFKSNDRIASDLKCSVSTAKRAVASLKKLGFIDVYRNGRKRIIVLSVKGKETLQEVQNDKNDAQICLEAGSIRPYSSAGNSAFMNSLKESHLEIGDFYRFRADPAIHELMNEWIAHREEVTGKTILSRQVEMSIENLFLVSEGEVRDAELSVEAAIIGNWAKFWPARRTEDW